MWRYDEGDVTHIGKGHSGDITGVKISPNGEHIVSVSADGGILRWKYPYTLEDTMGGISSDEGGAEHHEG